MASQATGRGSARGDDGPESVSRGLRRLGACPDWLVAAAEPERVGAALSEVVPELAAGEEVLDDCDAGHFRLRDGRWTFTYRVTIGGVEAGRREVALDGFLYPPGAAQGTENSVAAAFGSEGWRCSLPALGLELRTEQPDGSLTTLPDLTDPVRARTLIENAVRAHAPAYADLRLAACRPRVMRYSRGSRCTILYELEHPPGSRDRGWPLSIVAKTYRGDKGQRAYDGMCALWATELRRSVAIAEPLAYLPDRRVLLQGPVPGDQTGKDLIRSVLGDASSTVDELDSCMANTAAGLAALHDCGVRSGPFMTLENEVDEIQSLAARLAGLVPEVAGAAEPLLARVADLAERHTADPVRPSHGSFRPAQVLVHDGQVGFIDFDNFGRAEPALDVALFRAAIKDYGMVAQPSAETAVDALADRFLRSYQAVAQVSSERVWLWETLQLLRYVLHAWTKVRPYRLAARMATLERHLDGSGLLPSGAVGPAPGTQAARGWL